MHPITKTLLVSLFLLSPLACKGGEPSKAGGKTGSAAASDGQKSGSTAKNNQNAGASQGPDYDGVSCGSDLEGVGWCASDAEIVFCAAGEWWLLDCSAVEDGAYCGYDEDLDEVDCYAE